MKTKEKFLRFTEKVKAMGFDVYVSNSDYYHYAFVMDGDNIGYFQLDRLELGISFSTVNIPCKGIGTGFGLQSDWEGVPFDKLTKQNILDSFEVIPDCYKKEFGHLDIKKWTREAFLNNRFNKISINKF